MSSTQELKAQAYRTGWANIRDWVTAQMAAGGADPSDLS
jgi:hypothetical protein